ncbi:MAG TPA: hypothetical protein QGF02_00540 [Candidatus Babeliales bacterium]|nr:hypothetical protein [Candidatus Babeliales bacterium]
MLYITTLLLTAFAAINGQPDSLALQRRIYQEKVKALNIKIGTVEKKTTEAKKAILHHKTNRSSPLLLTHEEKKLFSYSHETATLKKELASLLQEGEALLRKKQLEDEYQKLRTEYAQTSREIEKLNQLLYSPSKQPKLPSLKANTKERPNKKFLILLRRKNYLTEQINEWKICFQEASI